VDVDEDDVDMDLAMRRDPPPREEVDALWACIAA
jgi:hypothetical protein